MPLSPRDQYLIECARESGNPLCYTCMSPTSNSPDDYDEIVCDNCKQNAAETAWERHCEDFHDGGSTRFNPLRGEKIR